MIRLELNDDRTEVLDVSSMVFPGGELGVHIHDLPISGTVAPVTVTARLQSAEDIVRLMLASEVVRRRCRGHRTLVIPYVPYARQDRVTSENEAFSLKAFASIINSLGYDLVRVFDPHSDVTPALIDNVDVVHVWDILESFHAVPMSSAALVAPDAGASKKVYRVGSEMCRPVIVASKRRDTGTGQLSGFRVEDETVPEHCLIVDDICDGGGTFVALAKILREKGARRVDLYVTHGIFSKGLGVFDGLIDDVYTTNSFLSPAIVAGAPNLFVKAVI